MDELPGVTRHYVVLGLLLVVSLVLALRSYERGLKKNRGGQRARVERRDAPPRPREDPGPGPRPSAPPWPRSATPGNLADGWEQVRAIPVRGGVLLEITPVRLDERSDGGGKVLRNWVLSELVFVSTGALATAPDLIAARRPCVGERKRHGKQLWTGFEVGSDGRTVVTPRGDNTLDIYRLVSETPDDCELDWVEAIEPTARVWPSLSTTGDLSWVTSKQVGWRDASDHHLADFFADTKPQWLNHGVLVLLGRHASSPGETVLLLLHTDVRAADALHAPRALLDASTLSPELDRAAKLLDLQAVGPDTLLVVTKGCPASIGYEAPARCLHRVRFRVPLSEQLGREPMLHPIALDRRDIEVRTLGQIDAYRSLAIAAEGKRAVYVGVPDTVDSRPSLFAVDIGETSVGSSEKIADGVHPDSRPRIGPDGRVVVIDDWVTIGELGERPTARAFVLKPT